MLDYRPPADLIVMPPPHRAYTRGRDLIRDLLYDSLYEANERMEIVPLLAAELPDYEDDGRTWVVRVRQGVRFHDGSELSASDVAFTYAIGRSQSCPSGWPACELVRRYVTAVHVRDQRTVAFRLSEPFAPLLAEVLARIPILPEAAVRASTDRLSATATQVDRAALAEMVARPDFACDPDEGGLSCVRHRTVEAYELLVEAGTHVLSPHDVRADEVAFDQYLTDLAARIQALHSGLSSSGVERIAAWLPLLDLGTRPVGTGPFAFGSRQSGSLVLHAHDGYFAGPPRVSSVELVTADPWDYDPATRSAAEILADGDAELAMDVRPSDLDEAGANVQVGHPAELQWYGFAFNLRPGRLFADSSALRTAVSVCIDRELIVPVLTEGAGTPVDSVIHPHSWANDGVGPPRRDVEAAHGLIRRAGWTLANDGIYEKDGRRLSTSVFGRYGPAATASAQFAQEQLAECGIELRLLEVDWAVLPADPWKWGDGDMIIERGPADVDPDVYGQFHSSQVYDEVANPDGLNVSGWSHPGADRWLELGRAEIDSDKRREVYARVQEAIRLETPVVPLFVNGDTVGLARHVSTPDGPVNLDIPRFWSNLEDWTVAAD